MAGYRKSDTTDLDSVFAPYTSGTKPAATGFRNSAGTDFSDLYAPIATGTAAAATGYRISNGNDVNTLFAAAGSVASVRLAGGYYAESSTGSPAESGILLNTNGTEYHTWYAGGGSGSSPLQTWRLSGASADYQARVTVTAGGGLGGSPIGSWVNITTSPVWSQGAYTSGAGGSTTFTLEIRSVSSGVILASASYTLEATWFPGDPP